MVKCLRPAENARTFSCSGAWCVYPVPPLWLVHTWPADDVLQNATIALNGLDRANVVVVTSHQHMVEPEPVMGELQSEAKDRRRVSLSPEFWNDDVPDVTAHALRKSFGM